MNGLNRVGILLLSRELIFFGNHISEYAHCATFIGIRQTIVHHRIHDLLITHTHATPRFREEVRRIRHILHATRYGDINRACFNSVMRHDGRLHPRTTHFIDRCRFAVFAETRLNRRLPRRRLALPRWQDTSHDGLFDIIRFHTRFVHSGFDSCRSEVWRRHRRKRPLESAHWGTGYTNNNNRIRHINSLYSKITSASVFAFTSSSVIFGASSLRRNRA